MGKKWNVVNQKEVDLIKALLEAKLSYSKIAEIAGRSSYVILDVKSCDGTLADYKKIVRTRYEKDKAERLAKKQAEANVIEHVAGELFGTDNQPKAEDFKPVISETYLNDVKVIAQRLDHIEGQIQELIDNHVKMLTILQSKKLIW